MVVDLTSLVDKYKAIFGGKCQWLDVYSHRNSYNEKMVIIKGLYKDSHIIIPNTKKDKNKYIDNLISLLVDIRLSNIE